MNRSEIAWILVLPPKFNYIVGVKLLVVVNLRKRTSAAEAALAFFHYRHGSSRALKQDQSSPSQNSQTTHYSQFRRLWRVVIGDLLVLE